MPDIDKCESSLEKQINSNIGPIQLLYWQDYALQPGGYTPEADADVIPELDVKPALRFSRRPFSDELPFSATALLTWNLCERKFFYKYMKNFPEASEFITPPSNDAIENISDEKYQSVPMSAFGNMIHKLLQIGGLDSQLKKQLIESKLRSTPITKLMGVNQRDQLIDSIEDILNRVQIPERVMAIKQAEQNGTAFPELPFVFKFNHMWFRGTMDLLYQSEDGTWQLVDYKTNSTDQLDESALSKKRELYRPKCSYIVM